MRLLADELAQRTYHLELDFLEVFEVTLSALKLEIFNRAKHAKLNMVAGAGPSRFCHEE